MNNSTFFIGFTSTVKKETHDFIVYNSKKYLFVFQLFINPEQTVC